MKLTNNEHAILLDVLKDFHEEAYELVSDDFPYVNPRGWQLIGLGADMQRVDDPVELPDALTIESINAGLQSLIKQGATFVYIHQDYDGSYEDNFDEAGEYYPLLESASTQIWNINHGVNV